MVRYATRDEIDFEEGTWAIPAARMKMRRDCVSPLLHQPVAMLIKPHQCTGRSRYLFPGSSKKQPVISENAINFVFTKVGYKRKLVSHGTRHTAITLLREHDRTKDHVEAQLAHKEDGISGAYNNARYLPQRRHMMQSHADYLEALYDGLPPLEVENFLNR